MQSLQKALEPSDQLSAVHWSTQYPKTDKTVVTTQQSDVAHHTFKQIEHT